MPFHCSFADEFPIEKLREARTIASQAIAQKDFVSALVAYNELSVQFADNIYVANDLAVIFAGMGKLDDARVVLERAIISNKTTGQAFLNLREILARQASISYTKALKRKSPSDVLALRSQGLDAIQRASKPTKKTEERKLSKLDEFSSDESLPILGSEIPVVVLENADEEIKQVISDWAKAWSSKDFDSYIGFYSHKFKTKKFNSKKSWAKYRKPRVTKKSSIKVRVQNPRIKLISNELAEIKFIQKYKSANLRLTTTKRMKLEKGKNGWKILTEGI
jgi:hypothetical protein